MNRKNRPFIFLLLLVISAFWTSALHAASSCRPPARLPDPKSVTIDWVNQGARVDSYLLVLSWSPEYCSRHGQRGKMRFQCRDNRFEFVVHGLWPQSAQVRDKFGHPRFCGNARPLSPDILKRHICTMPNVDLMQAQWAKHGACAFSLPSAYFTKIEELWFDLDKPDIRRLLADRGTNLTAGDVVRAFARSNGGKRLKEENVIVRVGKGQRLREVLICYDQAFAFKKCEVSGTPYNQKIRVAN